MAVASVYALYFYGIASVGLLGPDEPRYASIGREMARSGDWVSPRLWGALWFEKPPLTYWLAALGWNAGLGDDVAPRAGVALLSALFLLLFYFVLRREFGSLAAFCSTVILATMAGWVAFSQVCATDLSMSACFGAALLFCLRWLRTGETVELPLAGAALGLALLGKGLVPLVLFVPAAAFAAGFLLRRWGGEHGDARAWRAVLLSVVAGAVVALPWYLLSVERFGRAFLDDFFWKHHFSRFVSDALQHHQPFWFYLPVLVAGCAPWFPLLPLAFRRELRADRRTLMLLATVVFGLLFFSASHNKLPGYLLPLLPSVAVLLGVVVARMPRAVAWLTACALSLGVLEIAGLILPSALAGGLSRADWSTVPWWQAASVLPVSAAVFLLERWGHRGAAVATLSLAAVLCVVHLKQQIYPALDANVSARPLWRKVAPVASQTCLDPIHRNYEYGLNFYAHRPLPACADTPLPYHVVEIRKGPPVLRPASTLTPPPVRD